MACGALSPGLLLAICLHHVAAQTINVSAGRRYLLHVPEGYKKDKGIRLPVWILAPGSSDTPEVFFRMSGVLPLSDEHMFACAALEGSHLNLNVASHGQPVPWGPDDIQYTKLVLRDVLTRIDVDMSRIRCVGFSRGGRFCSRLASELSSFISAIAPIAGIRFPEPNNSTHPMPIIAFHGTSDLINPFMGNGNPQYWHEPVLAAIQRWADRNRCMRYKEQIVTPSVTYCMHFDCKDNADVTLVQVLGGGHTWPGTLWQYKPAWRFGTVNHEIDAKLDIFHFFEKHHRQESCHTAVEGEPCYVHVQWVKKYGLKKQPKLYGGLDASATLEEIQAIIRKNVYADCPEPCTHENSAKVPTMQENNSNHHSGKKEVFLVGRADSHQPQPAAQAESQSPPAVLTAASAATCGLLLGVFLGAMVVLGRSRLHKRLLQEVGFELDRTQARDTVASTPSRAAGARQKLEQAGGGHN